MSSESERLERFYAVTESRSVYEVNARGEGDSPYPYAEKIALGGTSALGVGTRIDNGQIIAIARFLQAYIPEGHSPLSSLTSFQRGLEQVNTMWWRGGTSPIVALFLKKEEALNCYLQADLHRCDPRWLEQTKEVLAAVGTDHPTFEVCTWPDLALIPPESDDTKPMGVG